MTIFSKRYRDYYNGVNGPKHSLIDAAKKVGLQKKTLDDYFFQLKMVNKCFFEKNVRSIPGYVGRFREVQEGIERVWGGKILFVFEENECFS